MNENTFFRLSAKTLSTISTTDIAYIKPPYVHFKRQHSEFIFYYILEGEMYLKEGKKDYHLQKNEFMILDTAMCHEGIKASTCRFLYVHFMPENGAYEIVTDKEKTYNTILLPKYHRMESAMLIMQCREKINMLVENFNKGMPKSIENQENYGKSMGECIFQELLLIAASDFRMSVFSHKNEIKGKVRETIPQVIEYLNKSYMENISGEMLAEKFNYHFDYLNRQFTKWTGKTIFVYLNTIRIERAKQLLMTGYYTVEEVSEQTGFKDIYYFSRVFRKYTGMSPGQIKQ